MGSWSPLAWTSRGGAFRRKRAEKSRAAALKVAEPQARAAAQQAERDAGQVETQIRRGFNIAERQQVASRAGPGQVELLQRAGAFEPYRPPAPAKVSAAPYEPYRPPAPAEVSAAPYGPYRPPGSPPRTLRDIANQLVAQDVAAQGPRSARVPSSELGIDFGSFLLKPLLPKPALRAVERVPYAGPPTERLLAGVSSPIGLATLPIGGVSGTAAKALIGSIAGQIAAGTAGEALKVDPRVQMGLEIGGGVAGGFAPFLRRPSALSRASERVLAGDVPAPIVRKKAVETVELPSKRVARNLEATQAERFPPVVSAAAEAPPAGAARLEPVTAPAPAARDLAEGVEVDDVFGGRAVGAARASSAPTQRDVEALSQRMPVQGRRSQAELKLARLAASERSLTYAEVKTSNGDRYQTTMLDPIFNRIRRIKGQDPKLIQDVRGEMVSRDIYVRQEGGVLTARGGAWLGKHSDTLGINLEKGTMTKVQVRPGVEIPKEVVQTPKDIARHPEDYIFTREQQNAWDEIQTIFRRNLLNEQRHGVDVVGVQGYYWPEVVIKAPGKADVALYRPTSQANMTVSPWFTKSRTGIDPRSAKAAGVEYANDFAAMFLRLEGSAEAVANRSAVDAIKAMGYKPSEQIAASLADELTDAQKAYRAARSLFNGTPAEQAQYAAALERLHQAKGAVRREARLLNQRSPKLFGRVVPQDVAEEFSRYIVKEDASTIDDMFRIARVIMVNGDYGSPFLQNFSLFWNNPRAWLKSTAMGGAAIRKAPFEYLAQNSDEVERAIRLGFISPPSELMLSQGGRFAARVGSIPPFKQAQRMFEWDIFVGQLERAKAHMRVGLSDKTLREIADVTRKQASILFEPGRTVAKANLMRKLFFAEQYTTALNAIFLDPLLKGGAARREAIKSMGMMLGGAASTTIGLNMLLNGELLNMDDPRAPGYWGVKLPDGTYVYPFGPLQPTIRALSEAAIYQDPGAITRFFESKASLPARWVIAAVEAMGAPIESIRGPAFGQPEKKLSIDEMAARFKSGDVLGGVQQAGEQGLVPIPLSASQTLRAVERGAPFGALEFSGIKTTLPPTERSKAYQTRQELEKIPRYEGLDPSDQAKVEDFLRQMEEEREEWRHNNPGKEIMSRAESIDRFGLDELGDPMLVDWAKVLASDTLSRQNLNPDWTEFIFDNWDTFKDDAPQWLYDLRAKRGRASRQ